MNASDNEIIIKKNDNINNVFFILNYIHSDRKYNLTKYF